MEKMRKYRHLVRQILEGRTKVSDSFPNEGIERVLILDDDRGHYMQMRIGWQGHKRVKWMTVYIRVKDDKIWIEQDLTENGFTSDLLEADVPNEDIVLAFHAPDMRPYTEFAAA
jgi:XisI protein